jgi:hypothetical protein
MNAKLVYDDGRVIELSEKLLQKIEAEVQQHDKWDAVMELYGKYPGGEEPILEWFVRENAEKV